MIDIFESFEKSLVRFQEILAEEENVINRDSAIQRFEFTVELAWKTLQKTLREEKIICRSPKECLQEAFKLGLIDDNEKWLDMIDDRNLTAHTYDETMAEKIYSHLPAYLTLLDGLRETLIKKYQEK